MNFSDYIIYFGKDDEGNDTDEWIKVLDENGNGLTIPKDPANRHYAAFLAWQAKDPENNVPQSEPVVEHNE